ncbi:HAMP domain-containing sensor histidine kinase [Flavivirga abyssicola]|uniref:sensor histidine kinase n=1 Tax=Flavivirga abyssicola TaxID=3063533 RepID=UPI0026DF9BB6|nr:HAMP domain-containing sensor histidine kinase [Flavivirga sp. MEBiC07777]WVK12751.1 HAMP domain-containing sensor histidine kinase [Flavivirga sp. MEBiC07777]
MNQKKKIKLLKKTSRSFLTYGLLAMVLSVIVLYFVTKYIIEDETEEALNSQAFRIEKLIEKEGVLINVHPIINTQEVKYVGTQRIKDTILYDPAEEELEPYMELITYKKINERTYKISVRTKVMELYDILQAIILSYVVILITVFLAQYYLSRKNTALVWKPFFDNLKKIKTFSIQSNKALNLEETDIEEFSELNTEIKTLTNKVISDYQNLKQFTEDVSHEIQTPLANIQAKIGNLFDENQINEKQYNLLIEISNNARRLATLNKKLILLAKIENQQFKTSNRINFTNILKNSIESFEGLNKVPILTTEMESIEINGDSYLARIIADNLLSNAIKYTSSEGEIIVKVVANEFIVSNSGEAAIKNPEKLYDRFYKENTTKKSLGLGLAIVKKICDNYDYTISYTFSDNLHVFKLTFN